MTVRPAIVDDAPKTRTRDRVAEDPRSQAAEREFRRDSALRKCRTCYDHLAGVAGVGLLDALVERSWLRPDAQGRRKVYVVTAWGARELESREVDLVWARQARRLFSRGCLDWTERRDHLGGALGAAILDALLRGGFIKRRPEGRTVDLTTPVGEWLGRTNDRSSIEMGEV